MSRYTAPGEPGSLVRFAARYDHFIGGEYVPAAEGRYFPNPTPVTGEVFTEVAEGTADDMAHAWQEAHGAAARWAQTAVAERAVILSEIADRIEDNLEALAVAETWDTGKPIRETLGADLPLASDHFRYFAGAVRAQECTRSQVDGDVVVHGIRNPLGVVTQRVSWDFPLLGAAWRLAPALAAGNTVVLHPSAQTPASVHVLLSAIADLVPPGVVNVVNGHEGVAPSGRGPAVFFSDVAQYADNFHDRALAGFATGTSLALVQHDRYEEFLAAATANMSALAVGHPLDSETTVGAQVSADELGKALWYIDNATNSGALVRLGGGRPLPHPDLADGYYVEPTVIEGDKARVPGVWPVVSVAPFNDFDDAVKLVNETALGRGVSVWSRDNGVGYRFGQAVQAERVWVNNDHTYFAEAMFGHEDRHSLLAQFWHEKRLLVNYA
ncbi:aldehyde dehydrogenase family protein [Actinocrispum wychmicini]|uniref:Aldehyde dehydrogenase n=1 Tax=Actinocrispum wychmicini TaxID=1213861 RepID=A0A4R2JIT5_9PSEU|nr:aldehyde dehydrogenase family protein [Actinocrispum wychmicini]TCO58362.1 aldehyde dehydrogenase [Actinocrispum wychmicini]